MATSETRNRITVEPAAYSGNGTADHRSIGDLLKDLSADGRTLVRQEVELVKAELSEKLDAYTAHATSMAVGGALLLVALMAGATAVIYGLIVLFDQFLPFEWAVWLAPLVLGAVLGAIGWSKITKAKEALSREGIVPQRAVETLRADRDWVRNKVRS